MIIDGLSGGGAEKVLLTLVKGLTEKNCHVSIFSLRDICEYIIPKNIEYKIIIDHKKYLWYKFTELNRRARILDLAVLESQKLNGKFDLIISHLHKTDRIVARSRILPRNLVWFCLHTVFSVSYLKSRTGLAYWLKYFKIRLLYQNRNLIAVSQGVLNDIKKTFHIKPYQSKVIYNPFDLNAIQKLMKSSCDLSRQDYLIHVGRIHKNKRQDRLLKAYAKSGIKIPLVILGKGDNAILHQLKLLAKKLLIADRVIFKSFNINPYPYIYHAKMLILSSDSEGFGNVLIEGLICQTPVVSTQCPGGISEILCGELSVGLAKMNTISLAKTISKVYFHNPPITASTSYLLRYDVSNICQQYIELIKLSEI